LQGNDVDQLVDKLARVPSKQEGLGMKLDSTRATLADIKREQGGLVADPITV
jgi:hypothetical protein